MGINWHQSPFWYGDHLFELVTHWCSFQNGDPHIEMGIHVLGIPVLKWGSLFWNGDSLMPISKWWSPFINGDTLVHESPFQYGDQHHFEMVTHWYTYQNGDPHIELGIHYYMSPHINMGITVLKWWLIDARIKMVITILKWIDVFNESPNQNGDHHFRF